MTKPRRYKCLACGNLTRFDVIRSQKVREFHHFTTGGELEVEEVEMLEEIIESSTCRWCESSKDVVEI